ncbi:hypothetical protein RHGRI_004238 [Rhododendron griersonianum]|uniref:RNase H type-1 domain-containing protein n=1 Tax=Rhododendron griersonianum TaxID=479676 RepID=A0AAV6L9X0_9ERIC|nr:hypothetical protein RHGRI_004238 [Rhododendron griersonianum]
MRIKEEIDRGNLDPDYFPKVIFLCWFIWKARNELIFHSTNQLPHVVVARALGAWDEFLSATESSTNQLSRSPQPSTSLHWIPPVAGSLKINCDASWSKGLNRGWGGIILRDNRGNLIDGRRFKISATSAFLAEASVLREACLFAKALNLSSVCIENDNAQLISLSVSELVPPWEVLAIISDIRLLAREEGLSFRWTPREGNEAAHWDGSITAVLGSPIMDIDDDNPGDNNSPKPSYNKGKHVVTFRHPWVEKYRPQSLADVAAHRHIVDTSNHLFPQFPRAYIVPISTGKTSTILAVARKLYGMQMHNMVLELNASDERGIDVIRQQIHDFASTQSFSFG